MELWVEVVHHMLVLDAQELEALCQLLLILLDLPGLVLDFFAHSHLQFLVMNL